MFTFDPEVVERVAAAIEDDLKPVITQPEPGLDDFDMEW